MANEAQAKLIEMEERETGTVSAKIYWKYILASGGIAFVILCVARAVKRRMHVRRTNCHL